MNGDYPTCSKDAVERDFATLRQSYNLGLPMRWKETRKDEDLEISEDGQEVRYPGMYHTGISLLAAIMASREK